MLDFFLQKDPGRLLLLQQLLTQDNHLERQRGDLATHGTTPFQAGFFASVGDVTGPPT